LTNNFFSFSFKELFSFVIVRLNIESISNVIDDIFSYKSGVSERLVVQAVDVFKPESVVVIVPALGVDKRRICFIGDFIWVITGFERDRFKHRHGNNDEVELNNS